jgi:vancomycin resistance protein YoaR
MEMKNEIYIKPINGKIEIDKKNPKKVTNLVLPKNGKEADIDKLILDLEKFDNKKVIVLQKEILPEISENDYGIREILGSGWSNFYGSNAERLHNINNAVYKLNNLLILPGENFSLIDALAPFTISNGYIDGLVIKGKKIIPEVGGGMCQLGTTIFRASMNSGMPITERRNHSLWLKYYNDPKNGNPGTDATIYGSSPDFKFLNDTGKHILVKAYTTKKADLIIELWGTKDGRIGTYTPPKIVNIIEPSTEMETNLVKELKPGEMICNGPFKGASTVFTYTRTLANGEKKAEQFWSYYKAEPLRCQTGPDAGYYGN